MFNATVFRVLLLVACILAGTGSSFAARRSQGGTSPVVIYNRPLDEIRAFFLDIEEHQYVLKGLLGKQVVHYAVLKSLKPVEKLILHPAFISVLVFPYQVVKADASFQTELFEMVKNSIIVRPKNIDEMGNMLVLLKRPDGKLMFVSLYVEMSNVRRQPLATYYVFVPYQLADPVEILEAYRKTYGDYPVSLTRFVYRGASYAIVPGQGNIFIAGNRYSVVPLGAALSWMQVMPEEVLMSVKATGRKVK